MNDTNSLLVPLFGVLHAISFGEHENIRYFGTGTLFWSITRLFGSYERVMSVLLLPKERRPYLDADIENFIIRFRIVLNDIAYIIWQLLPPNTRGLKGPKGSVHPNNREISFFSLMEFLDKHMSTYPEFSQVFSETAKWTSRLKNDRDNVVHYKAMATVFESDPLSFSLLNAAGTERKVTTPDGKQKLHLEPIGEFINGQMLAIHEFMHSKLVSAVIPYADRVGLKSVQVGRDGRITCIGISTFREHNGI